MAMIGLVTVTVVSAGGGADVDALPLTFCERGEHISLRSNSEGTSALFRELSGRLAKNFQLRRVGLRFSLISLIF